MAIIEQKRVSYVWNFGHANFTTNQQELAYHVKQTKDNVIFVNV